MQGEGIRTGTTAGVGEAINKMVGTVKEPITGTTVAIKMVISNVLGVKTKVIADTILDLREVAVEREEEIAASAVEWREVTEVASFAGNVAVTVVVIHLAENLPTLSSNRRTNNSISRNSSSRNSNSNSRSRKNAI